MKLKSAELIYLERVFEEKNIAVGIRMISSLLAKSAELERISEASLSEFLDSFRALADQSLAANFPYCDADIGALILENAADQLLTLEIRKILYREATARAEQFAYKITSFPHLSTERIFSSIYGIIFIYPAWADSPHAG